MSIFEAYGAFKEEYLVIILDNASYFFIETYCVGTH